MIFKILLLVLLGIVGGLNIIAAVAEDPPKQDLAAKLQATEQELRLTKLEVLVRREEIAAQQVEKIRADQQALFVETCQAAGIPADPKVCVIDLNAKTVTRRQDPKPEAKK